MPRPKGLAKTGGRVKGTLNKRSLLLANDLEERGFSFPNELLKTYRNLDPDKKAAFLLKMMDFYYTKPVQKEINDQVSKDQSVTRFYSDDQSRNWMEMVVTNPNGEVVTVHIPDNGSSVDSPLRKQCEKT